MKIFATVHQICSGSMIIVRVSSSKSLVLPVRDSAVGRDASCSTSSERTIIARNMLQAMLLSMTKDGIVNAACRMGLICGLTDMMAAKSMKARTVLMVASLKP